MHPSRKINISDLVIPHGIILADEGFNQPFEISCLIGSEHFFKIFGTKQVRVSNSNFRLIDSKFGYCVTVSYIDQPYYFKRFLSKGWNTLDKTLRSLWETENISEEQPIISDELSYCEKRFEKTHFRKPCGRYSVSLPFKENIQENVNLGDSRSHTIASKRLDQLWRRPDRDPNLHNLYAKSINEYLSLDHMEEITNIDAITPEEGIFFPHHGVLRAGNRSRPLRVVFNGSPKTDIGNLESIILYGFCDASEKGLGAVTYISGIKNNGGSHSQLLCSKSRVAPLKTLTIPRIELLACLLLSKLVRKVINA
ncbi:integrase catalytic domain-containing protein [Trichonephila clavipes]|nr:integrase catalytic domain-containing protein [Trichonephila clavipes]